MAKIGLDYGHGGYDPGALGGGFREADINLSTGLKVAEKLRYNGHEVVETRTSDVGLTLTQRTDFLKSKGCDSILSIHCNSWSVAASNGAEIYTYGTGTNELKLANCIYDEYRKLGFTHRGVKQANLHMVREYPRAAALIEMGFISNPSDRERLINEQEKMATAIAKGYCAYYNGEYKEKPTVAQIYRVKQADGKQLGAFGSLENARKCAKDNKALLYAPDMSLLEDYTEKETKEYLFLKAHVPSWRVYPLGVAPVIANACGTLAPSKFGGLEYEIISKHQNDIYVIQTQSFGKVQIYVPKDNDSLFYVR